MVLVLQQGEMVWVCVIEIEQCNLEFECQFVVVMVGVQMQDQVMKEIFLCLGKFEWKVFLKVSVVS